MCAQWANKALRNSTGTCSAILRGACPGQRATRPFGESHLNLLLDSLHFRRFVRRGAPVSQLMVGGDSVRSDRAAGLESGQKETFVGYDGTHDVKLFSENKQTRKAMQKSQIIRLKRLFYLRKCIKVSEDECIIRWQGCGTPQKTV